MHSFKVHAALVSTIVLWASAFVGIRIALPSYSPGPLALLRFLVASLTLAIIYSSLGIKKTIPWRDRIQLLAAGVAGIGVYNVCLNYGELYVSAGIASFVIGLMPVITVILSFFLWQERLKKGALLGIAVSTVGLFILTLGEGFQPAMMKGVFLVLISALMGAFLTIVQKKFLKKYHPVAIISWLMWGGSLFLLCFTPTLIKEMPQASVYATAAVVYMGVFPAAIAYLAWGYVLKKRSPNQATISLYALPLISTALGYVILGEQPSLISLVGGAIALLGALIASRYRGVPPVNLFLNKKLVAS